VCAWGDSVSHSDSVYGSVATPLQRCTCDVVCVRNQAVI
jgi:hypothetical protein